MGKYTELTDEELQAKYVTWEGVNPIIAKEIREEMALRVKPVEPVKVKKEVVVEKPKAKSSYFAKKKKK